MKKHQITILLLLLSFTFSCKEKNEKKTTEEKIKVFEPNVNTAALEANFKKWWSYHYYNISLSSNFTGLNEKSDTISKKQFLDNLISGNYIPLKLRSIEGLEIYKLFKLTYLADKSIRITIKNESLLNLKHFEMEGQPFPKFDFTDLGNNRYTNETTRGKTIILKTWFIGCSACEAEFPELNELVKKYEHRSNIVFVSLALDTKSELEVFEEKSI